MAASALTYLQIVNRVLVRLREEEVATIAENDYSNLVSKMVNAVKAEIEAAWSWHALRSTIQVNAVAGTTQYTLTASGMNAEIISAWNTTSSLRMVLGTYAEFDAYFLGTPDVHQAAPQKYILRGFDTGSSYDRKVDVWPKPNASYTLKFQVYVPQADLSATTDVPKIPQDVLVEETVARCLLEKGEDGARQPKPDETFILADMLANAVFKEVNIDSVEMDWELE
jgi:hypothetical protein